VPGRRRLLSCCAALVIPTALVAQTSTRIPPRPVQPPAAYRAALERGTRDTSGRPGPRYWQQSLAYRIRAGLDVATGRLTGGEVVTYRNHSPDTLTTILFHVDQNVYAPGAPRNRGVPVTGGVTIDSVTVNGTAVTTHAFGSGYYAEPTLMVVPLPTPLPPGDSARVAIGWAYTVPPAPTFRSADLDHDVFAVGQWYPRVAVYDDLYGWDHTPYLGDGEFYLEYGDFDVTLTLPAGWLVGATGTLENPAAVLPAPVRARLARAAQSDSVVHVVTADARGPGRATMGRAGQTLTWHYTAHDVRDFAWSTSAHYVWDAVRGPSGAVVHTLYRPQFAAWKDAWRYGVHALRSMGSLVGPYRYPQLTVTEGPIPGMEYPMIVFIRGGRSAQSLSGVIIHESSHQWFPMMVGSMEAKHAWMDEGFVTYWEALEEASYWHDSVPAWGGNRFYLAYAGTEQEVPLMRHTDLVTPYGQRTLAAYTKPAVVLGALRAVVGDSVFLQAFRDYFRSWSLRHPQPWDFFATVERHAGRKLDWFWRPLFYETDVLDQAVRRVDVTGDSSVITLADSGDVILPTPLAITRADGTVLHDTVAATRWLTTRQIAVTVPGRVTGVVIDPAYAFADVNRSNDVWPRAGGAAGTR